MTFSPFTFDVSHLFCLFNSIRLSIFHQKVHQIRKLAHYYHHTCLSTEHKKVVRFASYSFSVSVFFSFSQGRKERTKRRRRWFRLSRKRMCVCGKVEKEEEEATKQTKREKR